VAGTVYQVKYDRKSPDAKQWDRLNFILRQMSSNAGGGDTTVIKQTVIGSSTGPSSGAAGSGGTESSSTVGTAGAAAAVVGHNYLSTIWAHVYGEYQTLVDTATKYKASSADYVNAVKALANALGSGNVVAWPPMASPLAQLESIVSTKMQSVADAVALVSKARTLLMVSLAEEIAAAAAAAAVAGVSTGSSAGGEWLQEQVWDLQDAQ